MKIKKDIITIPKETTVTFMKNPEVSFVSLVSHGANNTPFRVLKSNKGGTMNKVVQSIRVLKGSKANLETLVGKEFRKDTIVEEGNYLLYEQVDKSVCNIDTKAVVVIDPTNHVYAVTYELLTDGNKDLTDDTKDTEPIPDTVVLSEDVKEVEFWDVYSELYSMSDLISGAMGQSNRTQEDRKAIVLSSIDNFRAFCETIFSEFKSAGAFPVDKAIEKTSKFIEMLQKQILEKKKPNTGGSTMLELESKEALVEIITETVSSAFAQKAITDAESEEAKTKAAADAKTAADREKEIADLKALVTDLTAKIDTVSGTVVNKTSKTDPDTSQTVEKGSVYAGMFSKLRSTPGGVSDSQ